MSVCFWLEYTWPETLKGDAAEARGALGGGRGDDVSRGCFVTMRCLRSISILILSMCARALTNGSMAGLGEVGGVLAGIQSKTRTFGSDSSLYSKSIASLHIGWKVILAIPTTKIATFLQEKVPNTMIFPSILATKARIDSLRSSLL